MKLQMQLSSFFVNIASKIKEPVENTSQEKPRELCQQTLPADTKFVISNVEKEKVLKYWSNIDISKATRTYGIVRRLLKLPSPHIAEHVTFICNYSINVSAFPNKWKKAKVTPLHKGGPSEKVNNY